MFRQIQIFPNFKDGHMLQWSIDPTMTDEGPYNYTVQLSETADFSELIYSHDLGEAFYFIDDSNEKQAWSDNHRYRVVLTTANNQYYSNSINFSTTPADRRKYAQAREIIRKEKLRMEFTGGCAYFLKLKSYGKKDVDFLDPVSGMPIDVPSNYGTGFVGGYYNPIKIKVSTEESTDINRQLTETGVTDNSNIRLRCAGGPIIENMDVIVFSDTDERYTVQQHSVVTFPGTSITLAQVLVCKKVPPTNNIYKIKVS